MVVATAAVGTKRTPFGQCRGGGSRGARAGAGCSRLAARARIAARCAGSTPANTSFILAENRRNLVQLMRVEARGNKARALILYSGRVAVRGMPKNIVLLSDGTGNSAAKLFKTNVWRLYQALDIAPAPPGGLRRQVAFYDEGVGSENFKPRALLGSAFGIGVWRNVRDLYTFTCRNYEQGDQIFAFGFSRGAFTVRLLVGLIGKCGLVVPDSEDDLKTKVEIAYLEYQRDFLLRASRKRYTLYHHLLAEPHYVSGAAG